MRNAVKTFVRGLFLSACFLLPTPLWAAELQPFFTLKVSSVNSLCALADKFAGMAGVADNEQFREFIALAKGIKGVNANGTAGFAAADNNGELVPWLILPVTDLWGLDVPNFPNINDSIRPFLVKKGEGRFEIGTPLGTYVAVQQKEFLIVAPKQYVDEVPSDPAKLFAGLEKFTLGINIDFEKVAFETIEGKIFGTLVMMVSMQDPDAGEQIQSVIEIYRQLFKELSSLTWGLEVNPETADIFYGGTVTPRKDADWARMLAVIKLQPTQFSGFRGTPENNVFSAGISASNGGQRLKYFDTPKLWDTAFKQYESLLTGIMEQIEGEDADPEKVAEKAKKILDSVKKIANAETKKDTSDSALSFSTEGVLLCGANVVSLAEIRNLVTIIKDYAGTKVSENIKSLINTNLRKEYTEIAGFKVSNINIPLSAIKRADLAEKLAPFKDLTLGIYWAVKEADGKQAVAFAAGLDSAKTEQAFTAALQKTGTPVSLTLPTAVFSTKGIGTFLQQTAAPLVEKSGISEKDFAGFKKIAEILAAADPDATVTLDYVFHPDRMEGGYRISGKSVQTVILAIKNGIESVQNASAIQNF